MKRLLTICMLAATAFIACDKEKNNEQSNGTLTGNWRQVSRALSSGGPIQEFSVDEASAEIMGFGKTGQFTSSIPDVKYNRYTNDDSTLTLRNSATGDNFKFYCRIVNDTMTLSPLTVRCVEGCYSRYVKVVSADK